MFDLASLGQWSEFVIGSKVKVIDYDIWGEVLRIHSDRESGLPREIVILDYHGDIDNPDSQLSYHPRDLEICDSIPD
tara:strand:- start:53 stop:283 length:231 start_codon:yes stop_codon:yes gene_type:complete